MVDIEIRAEASLDIADIYAFSIERFGREVAQDYVDGLDVALLRLVQYPESTPVFEGVKPRLRQLVYRSHRVLYDFDGRTVSIVRILHSAMNVPGRLRN
jgi:toxin ParE1/3/4